MALLANNAPPIGGLLAPDWPYSAGLLTPPPYGGVPVDYYGGTSPPYDGQQQGPPPTPITQPPPPGMGGMDGNGSISPMQIFNMGRKAYNLFGGGGAAGATALGGDAGASGIAGGLAGETTGGLAGMSSANTAGGLSGMFGGGSGAMGSLGPIGAFAAMIAAGKTIEHNNANNPLGRGMLSMLGPSFNQIKADPKLGLTTLFGLPFLNGFIRNDKAAHAKPEWSFLFGG